MSRNVRDGRSGKEVETQLFGDTLDGRTQIILRGDDPCSSRVLVVADLERLLGDLDPEFRETMPSGECGFLTEVFHQVNRSVAGDPAGRMELSRDRLKRDVFDLRV